MALGTTLRPWRKPARASSANTGRRGARRRKTASVLGCESLELRQMLSALGLVSHWTGDNTSLDAVGANHGTLVNGAGYATGQIGQAFSLDGVNDRVLVADSTSLQLTGSMTIEAWVRADALPAEEGEIFFRGDDRAGLDPYSLSVLADGNLRFEVENGVTASARLTTAMPLGELVHVVGTLDDATGDMRLYVDGVLVSQIVTAVRPFGDLDPAFNPGVGIGNHGGSQHNQPFGGLIDDLKVYDRAITAEEVLEDFNAAAPLPTITIGDATATEGESRYLYTGDFVPPDGGGLAAGRFIAVGGDGRVYVASKDTDSVKVYEGGTGAYLGDLSAAAGVLDFTWAITFGPDGRLYVAGTETRNILRFDVSDLTGTSTYDVFVPTGSGGLDVSKGLTFGPDGNLYVSSTTRPGGGIGPHKVLRFQGPGGASPGAPLPAAGKSGADFVSDGAGNLNNPNGLTFGPDGALYVASTFRDEIVRYSGATGAFLNSFVAPGSGGLDVPNQIAFHSDGFLYVASQGSSQVLRYNADSGSFHDVAADLPSIIGLAFAGSGELYASSGTPTGTLGSTVWRYELKQAVEFTVTLSAPSATAASVDFMTVNGAAVAGSDYAQTTGTLVFAPGTTSLTIIVSTINDSASETQESFSVVLSSAVGATIADSVGAGVILDDDATKFYVVDDAAANRTYEYGSVGSAGDNYVLNSGNAAPRGAASRAAGDKVWVVDANKKVFVYNASGALLGSWTAGGLNSAAQIEGIATNGTDIWLVDNKTDKVFKYTGAASRLSGSQNAASSFSLNNGNKNAKDLVTNGVNLWVVDDSSANKVFKYTVAGSLVGSWTISGANATPTGITLDPTGASDDLWIVDSGTDKVYQYYGGRSLTGGTYAANAVFNLAAGNTNPQGIADPPAQGDLVGTTPTSQVVAAAADPGVDGAWVRQAALNAGNIKAASTDALRSTVKGGPNQDQRIELASAVLRDLGYQAAEGHGRGNLKSLLAAIGPKAAKHDRSARSDALADDANYDLDLSFVDEAPEAHPELAQ